MGMNKPLASDLTEYTSSSNSLPHPEHITTNSLLQEWIWGQILRVCPLGWAVKVSNWSVHYYMEASYPAKQVENCI